ncbi:unnamed protein product [Rhizoctonia solani]|uniref:NADH-ubiquinone oxidoreductase n=1 Tax=Rhizoctonia solani TaxID=456999 RepID=A0A8H2XFS2_9AGAM|nr:unnamed protein product [Rhizoctonia solani]
MSTFKSGSSSASPYIDPTPLPSNVPHVDEIGVTSAPLKSAAFFIGAHCKEYNDDFMLCKKESPDPANCLKEGRRVTRCAADLIEKMRASCAATYDAHWQCLENNNQVYHHLLNLDGTNFPPHTIKEFYKCRKPERKLNECVFENLGLKKTIPGAPTHKPQVHELTNPIYKRQQK